MRGLLQWMALLITCAPASGCLLNSVRAITTAPRSRPDSGHAIVVIGIGVDVTWPYKEFQLTFPEYSVEKHGITGNCFHYNRIEATRPSIPINVTYLTFEVPANVYVYWIIQTFRSRHHQLDTPSKRHLVPRFILVTTFLPVIRPWNFGET